MDVTARTLITAVAASATLGGAVGALATAATTSQASPQAIATAVQRVQDQPAERYLRTVGIELLPLEHDLNELVSGVNSIDGAMVSIRSNTYHVCWDTGSLEQRTTCIP
jgi:hypothetical protein